MRHSSPQQRTTSRPHSHKLVRMSLARPHSRPAIEELPPPDPRHRHRAVAALVLVEDPPAPTLLGEEPRCRPCRPCRDGCRSIDPSTSQRSLCSGLEVRHAGDWGHLSAPAAMPAEYSKPAVRPLKPLRIYRIARRTRPPATRRPTRTREAPWRWRSAPRATTPALPIHTRRADSIATTGLLARDSGPDGRSVRS